MNESPIESILVKKIEFGDFDFILTYFTKEKGNISVIAKNAKKSKKRFSGKIELFSRGDIVLSTPKKGGMPILSEVSLKEPNEYIRTNIMKTAYASYWSEVITTWIPQDNPQKKIYRLFNLLLNMLNKDSISPDTGNIYFQMHFLKIIGFDPLLTECSSCGSSLITTGHIFKFSLDKGGILCNKCSSVFDGVLSKANVKQLLWIRENDFDIALKLKISKKNIDGCAGFLNRFLSYNTGREFKSHKVILSLESNI